MVAPSAPRLPWHSLRLVMGIGVSCISRLVCDVAISLVAPVPYNSSVHASEYSNPVVVAGREILVRSDQDRLDRPMKQNKVKKNPQGSR